MHPSPSAIHHSGYSSFFTSGLRAMTGRTTTNTTSNNNNNNGVQGGQDRSSFWSDGYFEGRSRNRGHNKLVNTRRRESSLMARNNRDRVESARENKKKRRSGLVTFSTRLFSFMSFASSSTTTTSASNQESSRDTMFSQVSGGKPSSPGQAHERSPIILPIDPFSSWSERGSPLPDSPPDAARLRTRSRVDDDRRESFLSFNSYDNDNNSSSNRSSVIVPGQERYTFLSISVSPESTISPCRDSKKFDVVPWNQDHEPAAEEEELEEEEQSRAIAEGYDIPAGIDWRQFHIDLMQDLNAIDTIY